MHILIIPSWYKNLSNPMAGTFFEEQARGLMSQGNEVGIFHVTFKPFSSKDLSENKEYIDEKLTTRYYTYKASLPRLPKLNYLRLCIFAYKKYKKYIQEFGKPDILHAHSIFFGGIIANYISKKEKIPFVITEHLTHFITGELVNSTDIAITKKIFENANCSIAVSNTFVKELSTKLNISEKKFIVVPNMVAPMFYEKFSEKKIQSSQPIRLFTNSFLSSRKNHILILNSFKNFTLHYPDAKLIIGGEVVRKEDVSYKDLILKLCNELGLSEKVEFLGMTSRNMVKQQMDNCHIFLLASTYETFGVVLIEALACGRPIITTDSKGPRDIVTVNNGILVKSDEAMDYAKAMLDLIKNYESYNQEKIRSECIEKFSEKAIISKLSKIYDSLTNANLIN